MPTIVAVGELLIDLISTEYAADFRAASTYERLPGGSPANLAMNLARLGVDTALVAAVGQDDSGALLLDAARAAGVDTTGVARVAEPTTLILVTKSRAVSNFEPYRLADRHISAEQLAAAGLAAARVVHTTAFALSQPPARENILQAFGRAAAAGARVSTDFNYADKIWGGDRAAGRAVFRHICGLGALVKVSDVDVERLFGTPVTDPAAVTQTILELGATVVCLTLGERGVFVRSATEAFHLPARPVTVRDTTGAGDAFWSGFLAAYVNGHDLTACAKAGRGMAERKLAHLGPLQAPPALAILIND